MAVEEMEKMKLIRAVISTVAILLMTARLRAAKVVHPTQVHG